MQTLTKYTISFDVNTSYVLGDQSKTVDDLSIDSNWIKQKVIDNKESIFLISSAPNTYNWNSNIVINSINKDSINKSLSFELVLKNSNDQGTQ